VLERSTTVMGLEKGLELGVQKLVGFGRGLDDSKVSRLKE
jgi:hypothetical protein